MTRLLARRTTRTVLGLLLLVEAIFLAESFTTILEQTVSNGGSALTVALLLLLKSPEVIDFALPLALLLGVFVAITASRDDNELVICATAGISWTRIPAFALGIGILGLCVSVLFAGVVAPMSSYLFRLSMYDLTSTLIVREITKPGMRNRLRTIENQTIIATPSQDPEAERGNLFIFHPEGREGWRVSQASDWTVIGPDGDGGYVVEMRDFRESTGTAGESVAVRQRPLLGLPDALQALDVRVRSVNLEFRMEDLIKTADIVRRDSETPLLSRLSVLSEDTKGGQPVSGLRKLGEVLARGLLCPVAALIAVAAAAASATGVGRFTALPVAAILVMAADVFGRVAIGQAAMQGYGALWAMLGAAALIGLGLPLAYILWRGELIIAPRRGRG